MSSMLTSLQGLPCARRSRFRRCCSILCFTARERPCTATGRMGFDVCVCVCVWGGGGLKEGRINGFVGLCWWGWGGWEEGRGMVKKCMV